jgi:cyclic pyranopterin phosphate synthase
MTRLSHVDESGKASMVDVSGKAVTYREASAGGEVFLTSELLQLVKQNAIAKGDVLATARIAGIQAGKKTAELIPLCHTIFLSSIEIDFQFNDEKNSIVIIATARTNAVTGVEMEALTAVSVAALTIYDMCKAVDKGIIISDIKLHAKSGGKSGGYKMKA